MGVRSSIRRGEREKPTAQRGGGGRSGGISGSCVKLPSRAKCEPLSAASQPPAAGTRVPAHRMTPPGPGQLEWLALNTPHLISPSLVVPARQACAHPSLTQGSRPALHFLPRLPHRCLGPERFRPQGRAAPKDPPPQRRPGQSLPQRAPGEGNGTMEKRYVGSILATKPQGEGRQESQDDQSYRHDFGQVPPIGPQLHHLSIYLVG